ncbi:MAG: sulfotransferase domain-containing protein [Anaerolineae bacterium]|nr:sulfotransferase domain-containing protein [Anaerolineae bacterium]
MNILRKFIPVGVRHRAKQLWLSETPHSCSMTNVYHCCVQKTGSRWLLKIFADERFKQYSGLEPYTYEVPGQPDSRPLNKRFLDEPFPQKTFATPLYMSYDSFKSIPKPERYRAFFIMRDPRDIVVSWYFSVRYSHGANPRIAQMRKDLENMSEKEGLVYAVNYLERDQLFSSLDSWIAAPREDSNIMLVKFEDVTGSTSQHVFNNLLTHCDIHIPDQTLSTILEDYSFERLSGRKQGQEDSSHHYRKGVAGDWRNHFDNALLAQFDEITGDLAQRLGYSR